MASQDVSVVLDIPVDTIPRYDKLQPMLLRSCCAEVELDPIYVQVSAGFNIHLKSVTDRSCRKQRVSVSGYHQECWCSCFDRSKGADHLGRSKLDRFE